MSAGLPSAWQSGGVVEADLAPQVSDRPERGAGAKLVAALPHKGKAF